jgi:hypothetical protein
MKDWARAEEIVRQMSGGRITPGSGNQRLKGDVRVGRSTIIEVKQTDQRTLNIQREWFDKLERESEAEQLILAVFFELRGSTYWWVGYNDEDRPWIQWSTMSVKEGRLPEEIRTEESIWELRPLQSLRELKNG